MLGSCQWALRARLATDRRDGDGTPQPPIDPDVVSRQRIQVGATLCRVLHSASPLGSHASARLQRQWQHRRPEVHSASKRALLGNAQREDCGRGTAATVLPRRGCPLKRLQPPRTRHRPRPPRSLGRVSFGAVGWHLENQGQPRIFDLGGNRRHLLPEGRPDRRLRKLGSPRWMAPQKTGVLEYEKNILPGENRECRQSQDRQIDHHSGCGKPLSLHESQRGGHHLAAWGAERKRHSGHSGRKEWNPHSRCRNHSLQSVGIGSEV